MASSRTCLSVITAPSSSSWASRSIERKSPRSAPLCRRSSMSRYTVRSRRATAASPRRLAGVGHVGGMGSRARRAFVACSIAAVSAAPISSASGSHLGAEERRAHDLQRQAHHRGGEVDGRAVPEALLYRLRPRRDHRGVVRDALVDERGRHHPTLAAVEVALAGEQPVAEERPAEVAEPVALHERFAVLDQHLVRELRRGDHVRLEEPPEPRHPDHVLVLRCHVEEEPDAVVAELAAVLEALDAAAERLGGSGDAGLGELHDEDLPESERRLLAYCK